MTLSKDLRAKRRLLSDYNAISRKKKYSAIEIEQKVGAALRRVLHERFINEVFHELNDSFATPIFVDSRCDAPGATAGLQHASAHWVPRRAQLLAIVLPPLRDDAALPDGASCVRKIGDSYKYMGKSVREWFDTDKTRFVALAAVVQGQADTEAVWRVVSYAIAGALSQVRLRAIALAAADGCHGVRIDEHGTRDHIGGFTSGRGAGVVCCADGRRYVDAALRAMCEEVDELAAKERTKLANAKPKRSTDADADADADAVAVAPDAD